MYESGERAIVRRGLKRGIEGGGTTAVQGRGGEQEQEALGGDGCMALEGGVIADDSELECTTSGGCSGHGPAARQECCSSGSLQSEGGV